MLSGSCWHAAVYFVTGTFRKQISGVHYRVTFSTVLLCHMKESRLRVEGDHDVNDVFAEGIF